MGWFDTVVVRHSARVSGCTSLVLTRLDVLDELDSVKIWTGHVTEDGEKVL